MVLDNYLTMKGAPTREGVDLIPVLRAAGCKACIIMHSGNNTEEDIARYRSHGASGAIGKGCPTFCQDAVAIYREFFSRAERGFVQLSELRS